MMKQGLSFVAKATKWNGAAGSVAWQTYN